MAEVGNRNPPPYHPANVSRHEERRRNAPPEKMQTTPQGHAEERRHPADTKAQEESGNVSNQTNSQRNTDQGNSQRNTDQGNQQ